MMEKNYKTSGPKVWKIAYGNRNKEQQEVAEKRKIISDQIDNLLITLKDKQTFDDNLFQEAKKIKDDINALGINLDQPGRGLNRRFNEVIINYSKESKDFFKNK